MAFEPLKPEDVDLVNRLLLGQPDLQNTISVIKRINAGAKYPIANFDALATAMGGESATVEFRGRTMTMADARAAIPAYYFPLESEIDLSTKLGDLAKALPPLPVKGPVSPPVKLMEANAAAPTHPVLKIDVDEVLKLAGNKSSPTLGGMSK